jgi:hypothetical protein
VNSSRDARTHLAASSLCCDPSPREGQSGNALSISKPGAKGQKERQPPSAGTSHCRALNCHLPSLGLAPDPGTRLGTEQAPSLPRPRSPRGAPSRCCRRPARRAGTRARAPAPFPGRGNAVTAGRTRARVRRARYQTRRGVPERLLTAGRAPRRAPVCVWFSRLLSVKMSHICLISVLAQRGGPRSALAGLKGPGSAPKNGLARYAGSERARSQPPRVMATSTILTRTLHARGGQRVSPGTDHAKACQSWSSSGPRGCREPAPAGAPSSHSAPARAHAGGQLGPTSKKRAVVWTDSERLLIGRHWVTSGPGPDLGMLAGVERKEVALDDLATVGSGQIWPHSRCAWQSERPGGCGPQRLERSQRGALGSRLLAVSEPAKRCTPAPGVESLA